MYQIFRWDISKHTIFSDLLKANIIRNNFHYPKKVQSCNSFISIPAFLALIR